MDARLVLNLLINLLKVDPENRKDLTEIMHENLTQLLMAPSRLDAAEQTIIDHFNPPLTESKSCLEQNLVKLVPSSS